MKVTHLELWSCEGPLGVDGEKVTVCMSEVDARKRARELADIRGEDIRIEAKHRDRKLWEETVKPSEGET